MAKGVEVKRDFKVLREVISPENVLVMAELITIKQTKCLIGYIGTSAILLFFFNFILLNKTV